MARPLSVLITGAGAPGTHGTVYALRHNPDAQPVRIIGVDTRTAVVGRYLVDGFYTVPHPEQPNYLDNLSDICRREAIEIVVPQTTREINILSKCKAELARLGVRVMVSDWPAIEIANDKCRIVQEFQRIHLPVPAYVITHSEQDLEAAAARLGYPEIPVVVKPRSSNGMRGVRVVIERAWNVERFLAEKPSGLEVSLHELFAILRRGTVWPELLVSEYLPGVEYSVDAFMGERARVAIPRLRRSIRSGISFENEIEYRDDLCEYSLRAAEHIGLRYAIGFQFKLDRDGVPKVLESNPRVQGTMVASVFSGANVIWMGMKELLGDPCTHVPAPLNISSFYRFWGGIGVCGDAFAEI